MLSRSELEAMVDTRALQSRASPELITLKQQPFHQKVALVLTSQYHGDAYPPAPSELLTFLG